MASRINWSRIGLLIGAAIVCAAVYTLYHLLRDIDPFRIAAALRSTPPSAIALAAALVAASYVTITFYDFFALRTIGMRHVPYRIAAMTGLMSYVIGHNLGATVFTGGAIRYRIYSAWGLTLVDVAKIAFVTGLTFWLGNAFMLGLCLSWAPEAASAINRLPPWVNRTLAITTLLVIAAYVMWLVPKPRRIGRNGWQVTLPSARLTLVQIGIGIADLTLAALAMFALVAVHAGVEPVTLIVSFTFATLLGFLSHAPGSLGVFDAAMLLAIRGIEKEQLVAALLLFRTLYFVVPFCLALAGFALRESWLAARRGRSGAAGSQP